MLALLLLTWCLERWSLGLRCSAKIGRFIRAMWWLVLVCVCACVSLCVCLCVFAHARSCVHVLDRVNPTFALYFPILCHDNLTHYF